MPLYREYLVDLRKRIDELKERTNLSVYRNARRNRTRYCSTSSIEPFNLVNQPSCPPKPNWRRPSLAARVLCEDLFLFYWSSLSESNAAAYKAAAISEAVRLIQYQLKSGRARTVRKAHRSAIAKVLPKASSYLVKRDGHLHC